MFDKVKTGAEGVDGAAHAAGCAHAGAAAAAAVEQISAGLDALAGVAPADLSDAELRAVLELVEQQARRFPSLSARILRALDERAVARRQGLRDTAVLLRRDLRLAPGEARARLLAATVADDMPVVVSAQDVGELSVAHALVIAETLDRLPQPLRYAHRTELEAELTDAARTLDPVRLRMRAQQLLRRLDPAGLGREEHEQERRRAASLVLQADGSADLRAHLTPAGAAIVQAAILPLAAPRPADAAGRDERSAAQRLHDGLVEGCRRLLSAKQVAGETGAPATVIVTVSLAELEARVGPDRIGTARTQYGGRLTVGQLLKVAGEADVVPLVSDARGAPLHVGRARRFATRAQTYALIARDRGCSFPGCDHPPPWTQRHHIRAWADGGGTDIENLTLLCPYHHANFERLGWECRVVAGVVYWRPPSLIDADRRLVRNTAHDDPAHDAGNRPANGRTLPGLGAASSWPRVGPTLPTGLRDRFHKRTKAQIVSRARPARARDSSKVGMAQQDRQGQ